MLAILWRVYDDMGGGLPPPRASVNWPEAAIRADLQTVRQATVWLPKPTPRVRPAPLDVPEKVATAPARQPLGAVPIDYAMPMRPSPAPLGGGVNAVFATEWTPMTVVMGVPVIVRDDAAILLLALLASD